MISKKKLLKQFGAHVRHLRGLKELTQAQLAAKMDKDKQSLQRVERGAINPSLYYLHELAEALDLSVSDLTDF